MARGQHSETIQLRSKTLTTLVAEEQIDLKRYNGLFMDVQGAEMLVLEGAEPIIREFKYVRTEAADFESYRNGCQLKDLRHFFKIHGFREFECTPFAHHPECGSYYEVTFKRID